MRVGVYQNNPAFGEVERNVEQAVKEISSANVDLVVLPEFFNTGYQFVSRQEALELAEEIPSGETCRAMSALARSNEISIVFGLPEREGNRVYNSAAVVNPEGFLGRYRKIHLFFEEKAVFDPGDTELEIFETKGTKIGVMICFDWIFPESTRILALLGARIICHPANLVLPYCQDTMLTRSLENGVFSLTANRVGTEARGGKDGMTFTGGSQIVDNRGRRLAAFDEKETGVLTAEIEPNQAENKRVTIYNDLFGDRRPDFYHRLI